MNRNRKIALSAGMIAVAMGAGHLVQSNAGGARQAAAAPTGIVTLSAGPGAGSGDRAAARPAPAVVATAVPRPVAPAPDPVPDTAAAAPGPGAAPPAVAAPAQDRPEPDAAPAAVAPAAVASSGAARTPAAAGPVKATPATPAAPAQAAETCTATLSATAMPGAVLSLALVAPCDGDARVVLRHAGLAVTGRLSSAGTLFTTLPAMDPAGQVSALFPDGTTADAAAATEMAGIRRFAVQWQGDDAFQLQVYENGAAFGAPGHVSAATPVGEGRLAELGDGTVERAMLAQVYTWPAPGTPVEVTLEAAVTARTCNREMLGEALETDAGKVTATEITLAMPDCSGVGDFLLLNNLAGQTTLAAAE